MNVTHSSPEFRRNDLRTEDPGLRLQLVHLPGRRSGGNDPAGVSAEHSYVRLPCTGRIDFNLLVKAFEIGADAVLSPDAIPAIATTPPATTTPGGDGFCSVNCSTCSVRPGAHPLHLDLRRRGQEIPAGRNRHHGKNAQARTVHGTVCCGAGERHPAAAAEILQLQTLRPKTSCAPKPASCWQRARSRW